MHHLYRPGLHHPFASRGDCQGTHVLSHVPAHTWLKQAVQYCCSAYQSRLHINDVLCIIADALRAAAMRPPLLLLDHPMRPPQLVPPHHVIGGCARTAGWCFSHSRSRKRYYTRAATRQASAPRKTNQPAGSTCGNPDP